MATLYELTEEYMNLLEMAEDPDIDPEILKDTMEGLDGELEWKADCYTKVMKELEAEADKLKKEADRLTARKKVIENNIGNIKKSLEATMLATGKTKFKTELFSFGIQKNPASVKIAEDVNINEIPPEYLKWKDPEIDKAKIKEDIKAGKEFEWAILEQSEGLRIR